MADTRGVRALHLGEDWLVIYLYAAVEFVFELGMQTVCVSGKRVDSELDTKTDTISVIVIDWS